MKRIMFWLFLTLTMLFSVSTVAMGVGVFGSTDLMITPTTATLNPSNMGVAINFSEGEVSYFNFDYGLARDLEIGLAVLNFYNETELTIRGKYQLLHETGDYPGLAIGVQDLGMDNVSPYLVVSKRIPDIGVTGYLGAGGGGFDGIFGGINKTFNMRGGSQLSQLDLFLEADSYGLNIGTKLGIGSRTKINFGLVDMEYWMLGAAFQF